MESVVAGFEADLDGTAGKYKQPNELGSGSTQC